MNQAIQIIQADMREYSGYGHSCMTYSDDHVLAALIAADVDLEELDASPGLVLTAALLDLCMKAMKQ